MIRNLIPWTQLTRFGIPDMQVARRPLAVGEVTLSVGAHLDPSIFPAAIRRSRLRQFYESRRLEPVIAPTGSRQATRPTSEANRASASLSSSTNVMTDAARHTHSSVAAAVIPSLEIPVSVSDPITTYTPARQAIPARKGAR